MPGLAKKLLVFAAIDGLFLQPVGTGKGVKIDYGTTNKVTSTTRSEERDDTGFEVHGIIGLLNLVSSTFLISITSREEVANVWNKPIYLIRDVTLIPLSSKAEASKAIALAQGAKKRAADLAYGEETDESDVGEDAEVSSIGSEDDEPRSRPQDEAGALEVPKGGVAKQSTTFVKNVVQEKGKYGRFASQWFSKNGGQTNARRSQGLTKEQVDQENQALPKGDLKGDEGDRVDVNVTMGAADDEAGKEKSTTTSSGAILKRSTIERLTPRILRSARLYFSSSGFYFSYEHDLSGTLRKDASSSLPLWKRFDSLFFWNRHLINPFIEANQDSLVLPLIQGFVGQRQFSITTKSTGTKDDIVASNDNEQQTTEGPTEPTKHDFLLTLISRRSVKRAGLRYLRRGVDDEGFVANNVETEQILSSSSWGPTEKAFSLVQTRGSMPLFFSQSPYSFKPLPVMFGSDATNQTAFRKHFTALAERYGRIFATSLVDKHGTEVGIGEKYERNAKLLNEDGGVDGRLIGFEWFDFHGACKGMKFENVSILMETLQDSLHSFCWNEKQNGQNTRQQTGVLRTNCMDCLDRTNVVQSAVAGWALSAQLAELGLTIDLQKDSSTQWFNGLWADNGDACSNQYAGTSALKGDFTRTRKRNWVGALNDFSLTLNRYYNNLFGDYFLQTNIDYFLGNAGPSVFDEFETDMMSQDYALDMRNVRQNAIDTCIKIVLEDPKEDFIAGWTLQCPRQSNTLRSMPFEECVLLLTDSALYFCRFDWRTEKVGSFERVDLLDIKALWRGTYITSTLGEAHLDAKKNVGFALKYQSLGPTVRTNTRSMSVSDGLEAAEGKDKKTSTGKDQSIVLAFKALPPKASAAMDKHAVADMNEIDSVKHICEEIRRTRNTALQRSSEEIKDENVEIEERDIISAADARKSTSYVESLGYSLKKLVWS
ncbi:related to SAC1-recessive suppressor of secretory defect [Ramularia collo-cygni]|uniref:Related to SAC1-recessive suppressor of secretory defect n=1 Tax=Ramularia collo-cygni TaxID=112498 RepID=A0A2D3V7E6_9PEZI|nr:related to SAC1-recessive suppressor of secretory defect [Ramularia collo-cygni]CZT23913.1 related to SAC1-recessive suppressor of secretory defect [Ramularia collo-cygni]